MYNDYIGWRSESLKARNKKIKTLLGALDEIIEKTGRKINVLVFPEYAIEKNTLNLFEEFSQKHKTIVVVGYYDDEERQSIGDILVPAPDGIRHYKQYKLYSSIHDKQFLSNVKDENKKYYRFVWQPEKSKEEQNFIHIFVCIDFLRNAVEVVDTTMAGLIICPMCTPKIDAFYGLSEYFMRAAEGYNSIVTSLSNSTDISLHQNGIKACGESRIVGPYGEKQLPILDYLYESGILARVKLNSALTIPTRIESDEVISVVNKFFIESDGKIKDLNNLNKNTTIAINPNVIISGLGLRRIYVFYNAKDYYDFSQYVKRIYLPMQCHGIFGVYDVLFQGYEENWDFFELRLMSYIGPKYDSNLKSNDKRLPEHYEITEVWKFRGRELIKTSGNKKCWTCDFDEFYSGYLENNLKNIRNIYLGNNVDAKIKAEFENKGIVFEVDRDSDITYEEKKIGLEEYLVFLFLYPSGSKETTQVMMEFQESILPTLMKDNRIRTIEFSSEQGSGITYPKGTYILHVVGKLDDLRKIILDYIHGPLYEKKISCGTRVVPTAEPLSKEEYLSLNETMLNDPALRYTVHDIIYYLKYSNRFIIKQLPIDIIKKVARFYTLYKSYVKSTAKSQVQINEPLDQLDQFIYGFCDAYINQGRLTEEIFETLRGRCAGTYNSIAIQIEATLTKARENILSKIDKLDDDIKKQYRATLKNENLFTNIKQTILGTLAMEIYKWNTKIAKKEHRILDDGFTEAVGKLQSVAYYRNYFSHAFRETSELENRKTSEFANELLNNIITAFNFLKYAEEVEKLQPPDNGL